MKRLVVWGGLEDLASHRHVQRAFYENAVKLGIPAVWLPNSAEMARQIQPGDTVLTADVLGTHLPYIPSVDYCLHNYDGAHPLCRALEQTPERLLRLQVWTDEAQGETWGQCRSFHLEARTLFQPWGTDLLASEFKRPVFTPDAREVTFVGAVWADQHDGVELGNMAAIDELKAACAEHRLVFHHLTHVSDQEQRVALRSARLTPALAGAWQAEHGYLPCRCFKLPSYGCAMFTNVPTVNDLFGSASLVSSSVEELVAEMLSLDRDEYVDLVRGQQDVASEFTYEQSLRAIERAFAVMQA